MGRLRGFCGLLGLILVSGGLGVWKIGREAF